MAGTDAADDGRLARRRPARSGEEVADQDGGGDEASEDEEIDTVNRIMGFLRSEYGEGEDPA